MTLSNRKKRKACKTPSQSGFMPRVGLKRLERLHRKEKAGKSKMMLDAACCKKRGHAIRQIGRDMGMAYSTVRVVMAIKFAIKSTTHMRVLPAIATNTIAQPNRPA